MAGDLINTDLHQGDWEHVTVLLDANTGTKQRLWPHTLRLKRGSVLRLVVFHDGHPIVQAALGGPTYDCCQVQPRAGVDPWGGWPMVVRGSGWFAFRAQTPCRTLLMGAAGA